jgi:very-short-patch-repair endonuclease
MGNLRDVNKTALMRTSILEKYFEQHSKELGITFEPEYKFHPTRKWRFDFADVENKIAIEIEGGVWTRGRHTRGSGYIKDVEKYNAATVCGWKVLRYCTTDQISENFEDDYKAVASS